MTEDSTLAQAYAVCRAIAKREAKNFYYSFVALPAARRDAICAIYAFMRKADDLSDDESIPLDERRKNMAAWREKWRETAAGVATTNPVFIAVRDAIARFNIPLELLEELIDGTTMDLDRAPGSADSPDTYATFDDLYRYCYLVASVVGLVCIRIFGYSDKRAEKLAEETGIAFQLTNILRDVAEDAARNRVYLPLDELSANGVSVDGLLHRPAGSAPSVQERALLASIGARAEKYYESARELLPLIDTESRPALWVLVRIYRRLLIRMKEADYDVFSRRVAVPTYQKLEILAVGMTRMAFVRIFG
ncbi:MAG: phytoene/squalene synthase family protein [Acidobacteriota bacterium]|nr:phytoene/squalene synthase family protein [Acidobacteriota bacterium]